MEEHLKFDSTIDVLSNSSGRALGGIISKFAVLYNLRFRTYTTLYANCIALIMDYCAGVWGFKNQPKCNKVQNRACRIYMGIHKLAPLNAIHKNMGWD